MGARREGRIAAMRVLYQLDTLESFEGIEEALGHYFASFGRDDSLAVRSFARELCNGAVRCLPIIDRLLGSSAANWRVERMTRVDRNIMRIAAFEMIREDPVPPRVAISEACAIARQFGCSESGEFVGGVLEMLRRLVNDEAALRQL